MAERLRGSSIFAFVSPLLSAVLALVGWSYIAGGKMAALEMRAEQNRAAIVDLRIMLSEHTRDQAHVIDLLATIDKRLARMEAQQELLHGRR